MTWIFDMSVHAAYGDLQTERLLPGEKADIEGQIVELLGVDWLRAENVFLGGRSPSELIGTDDEARVRDVLRSLSVSALS